MQRPWPDAVDRLIGPSDEPVVRRGPARWSVGPVVVWRTDPGPAGHAGPGRSPARSADPGPHLELLVRLAGAAPFPAPRLRGRAGPWVVTELGPGERADRPDRHPEPGSLPRAVGLGLAALHALPPDLLGRPVDAGVDGWAPIIERCRAAVESGAVDPAALRPPYDRYGPERLLELLVAADGAPGAADRPDRPDAAPVLCHGSPTLDRILVDGDRFAGFDGFETSLVADRHLDLAIAHLAVAEQLGAEAVIGLYEGYGAEPHLLRLDRAVLAAQLLGLGAGSAPGAGSGRR